MLSKGLTSGTWNDQIYSTNFAYRYPRLFADGLNNLHILMSKSNSGIYYAPYGSSSFTRVSDISDAPGDVVLDPDGLIHIFYPRNHYFHHAYSSDNGSTWTDDTLYVEPDENIGHTIVDAVDPEGNISTAYTLNGLDDNVSFLYHARGSNSFAFSKTGTKRVGRLQLDLAVDTLGNQYMTTYEYNDKYCLVLLRKEKNASSWQQTFLLNDEDLRNGSYSSIALDPKLGIPISANGVSHEVSNKFYYLYYTPVAVP